MAPSGKRSHGDRWNKIPPFSIGNRYIHRHFGSIFRWLMLVCWTSFDQSRLLVLARDGFGRIPKTKARTVLMSDYTTLPGTFCSESEKSIEKLYIENLVGTIEDHRFGTMFSIPILQLKSL